MSREVFLVKDGTTLVYCTMSPSKAYSKAIECDGTIEEMELDHDPPSLFIHIDLSAFKKRKC